ncbi:cation transporter [Terrimonas sp. NA20]|uniref:Cation transporter n=1 Tax=Terrimonas ginsenosidimutans TaxID=2908004 RepID=A0ABS9KTD3_9BACT|nr:heavy metal-associated domain-containing protein [Terrimonas ginsenosidimutans]MCG2615555.1 cation transporter [Terrimonas ginsenosidimutans]
MTHSYNISGMTCNSCVARVKSELLKLGNIESAEVQLTAPQATITMNQHINTGKLQEAVSKAGHYTISEADGGMHDMSQEATAEKNSYFPIFLIFGYITGISLLIQFASGTFNWMQWMSHFMGGFFLVFSFFKLMNLRGFAEGYRSYDIVAKAMPAWGFIYPFVELALGIAFLISFQPLATNIVTLVVMAISSVGVIQNLMKNSPFQCACLGTVIKLPLSKVTLFEDLLMVAMSAVMVIKMWS